MTRRNLALALTYLVTAVAAGPAFAHIGQGDTAGGFNSGFMHPLSGIDHICAMVAVGLWGAQLGMPAIWVLPVAFPTVMAFGGFLGLVGFPLPGVEIGIALSALVLGSMVLFAVRPPLWVSIAIVGVFALFHGHAHGAELPEGENGLTFSLGFVIATGLLHACGIAIGILWGLKAGKVAVRALGGVVALAGPYFLWSALAGG